MLEFGQLAVRFGQQPGGGDKGDGPALKPVSATMAGSAPAMSGRGAARVHRWGR